VPSEKRQNPRQAVIVKKTSAAFTPKKGVKEIKVQKKYSVDKTHDSSRGILEPLPISRRTKSIGISMKNRRTP